MKNFDITQRYFFVISFETNQLQILKISEIFGKYNGDFSNIYFAFMDPSNTDNPGWPLRIFLAAILDHCPELVKSDIKVIGIRMEKNGSIENSRLFIVNAQEVGK